MFTYSGRDMKALETLADEIRQHGGWAKPAQVNAMNEVEIESYLRRVVADCGRLDIVFNGIGVRPSQSDYGVPTTQLSFEQFMKPIETHVGSQFLMARIAAKYMREARSPVLDKKWPVLSPGSNR